MSSISSPPRIQRLPGRRNLLNMSSPRRLFANGAPNQPAAVSTNLAVNVGTRNIPRASLDDGANLIGDSVEDGTEMIELHGNPNHYFTKSSINSWIAAKGASASNPITRAPITQTNMKRYTAHLTGGLRKKSKKSRKTRNARKSRKNRR